jgi:uncharacterized membrane protein YdjX (TVP38/TMEM64 family)
MPAIYTTAQALALPIFSITLPFPERQTARFPWARDRSAPSRRASNSSPYSQNARSFKDQILRSADKVQRKVISTFQKLGLFQRILAVITLITCLVFGILFLVYNDRIFGMLAPFAEKWREIRCGWTILWALTFIAAFPPLIGYSTTITIAGFVYGFPNGWFIVATATVAGSLASFMASRTVLSSYVHRLVGEDKRFNALALTLKHDGLKILCMIRFCPLPYSLSNAAISTFPTVHPLMFALATAIASPKLLIHVFIGSRLASLAENKKMDSSIKAINYASIIIGAVLGAAVGWIIYQRTMIRARDLETEELEAARGASSPSLSRERSSYSDGGVDDSETDAAALMNDDDISLWDNDDRDEGYTDNFTDDEDVFPRDVDEEAAIGGKEKRKPQT